MAKKHIDVLIIGAGISGIGTAAHLQRQSPARNFLILERRESYGGTWDLFKYPGIRSDSDMSTFGFNFKPWRESKILADGNSIKNYLNETVTEFNLENKIAYNKSVLAANWDEKDKLWHVSVEDLKTGDTEHYTTNFLMGCTGYYDYKEGYMPEFPNQAAFKGKLFHPQHWPEDLDYKNKKVVIIGSGATAITLVPNIAKEAAHVTMLQRSPTYIASIPSVDFIYDKMRKVFPESVAYNFTRQRNVGLQRGIYALSRSNPKLLKKILLQAIKFQVGNKVDMRHFTPKYNPWDQRLCVVPDGDLFKSLKRGEATIETDEIEKFVENGIILKSGKLLEADIVVAATGLKVQLLGGVQVSINGKKLNANEHMLYRGMLISDVPNSAIMIGYVNASWTLKVDIAADYITRLLNYMSKHNYKKVVAIGDPAQLNPEETVMGSLAAGYIKRAEFDLPKQGKSGSWMMTNNYLADKKDLQKDKFNDGIIQFSK